MHEEKSSHVCCVFMASPHPPSPRVHSPLQRISLIKLSPECRVSARQSDRYTRRSASGPPKSNGVFRARPLDKDRHASECYAKRRSFLEHLEQLTGSLRSAVANKSSGSSAISCADVDFMKCTGAAFLRDQAHQIDRCANRARKTFPASSEVTTVAEVP